MKKWVKVKPNAALIQFLAQEFGVTTADIKIQAGLSSHQKLVNIRMED